MKNSLYIALGMSLASGLFYLGTQVYAQTGDLVATSSPDVVITTDPVIVPPTIYQIQVSRAITVFTGTLDQLEARKKTLETKISALQAQRQELDNSYAPIKN